MKLIEKLKDIVMGPKKAVLLDGVEEGLQDIEVRYFTYLSSELGGIGGLGSGPIKISGKTLGRKGYVKLTELDSKKEHCLDYCVIDFKDIRGYPKNVQMLNPNSISEEQLDKLVQKIGESFEIRVKKTIPAQDIHTLLGDFSLFEYIYSTLQMNFGR